MKKLKLRIAKFDRMLVVEQLQRNGEWKESKHIWVHRQGSLVVGRNGVGLCSDLKEFKSHDFFNCDSNEERDEYAANLVNWITEEQFGGAGKLEIGKPCLVRTSEDEVWEERIFAGKLSQNVRKRDDVFLTELGAFPSCFVSWKYAKPLNSAQPQIDGEIYTWEVEE